MTINEILGEGKLDLNYIGNCTQDDVIEDLFGDVTSFAQAVENYGDEFIIDDLVVKYDPDTDIHSFYYKDSTITEGKPTGGLTKWFREKWVNIAKKEGGKHPACGTSGETQGYAKCVPAKKAASMSAKQKRSAVNRKRSAQRRAGRPGRASGGTGKAPVRVKTDK